MGKDKNHSRNKKGKRNISGVDKLIAGFIIASITASLGISIYASTINDGRKLRDIQVKNIDITCGAELEKRIRVTSGADVSGGDTLVICGDLILKNLKLTETIYIFDRAKHLTEEHGKVEFSGNAETDADNVVINISGVAYKKSAEQPVLMQIRVSDEDDRKFSLILADEDHPVLEGCTSYEIRDIQVTPWPSRFGKCEVSSETPVSGDADLPICDLIGKSPEYPESDKRTILPVVSGSRLCGEALASDNKTVLIEYEANISPERVLAEYDIEMFKRWWMRDQKSATGGFRMYRKGDEAVALEILAGDKSGQTTTRYRVTAVSESALSKKDGNFTADGAAPGNPEPDSDKKGDVSSFYFRPDATYQTKIIMPEGTVLRGYSSENSLVQSFDLEVPGGVNDPDKVISCGSEYPRIVSREEAKGCKYYKYRFAYEQSTKCSTPAAAELRVYDEPISSAENRRCLVTFYSYPKQDTGPEALEEESLKTVIKDLGTYNLPDGSRLTELFMVNNPAEKKSKEKASGGSVNGLEGVVKPTSRFPATLNIRVVLECQNENGLTRTESRWLHRNIQADTREFEELPKEDISFKFALPDNVSNIEIEEVQLVLWPVDPFYRDTSQNQDEDYKPAETVGDLKKGITSVIQSEVPGGEISSDSSVDGKSIDCVYESDHSGDSLLAYFDCAVFNQGWYRDNKLLKGNKRRYTKAGYEMTVEILPGRVVMFEGLPGSYERTRYRLSIHPG
ncbi:MAG: hypothetical protein JXA49_08900 [Actinobacteria bacterium]|nr:hypothetical protein [Actinomycetota bacterium]